MSTKGKAWVVNSKVKKNAEVCIRKLHRDEQVEFEQAMKKEVDSFVSQDAVQICSSKGIDPSRVMQMRWVHIWKPLLNDSGVQEGRKAKARLIIKGFQDPRLTYLPRESPTLATLGRNMLLTQCARRQFQLSSGDISTAFLQGNHSEINEDIFGAPPPEVRKMLNMKEHEILRITKAIYGLLNAPKQWFESLSSFLVEDGWIPHGLDKCLYKWVEDGVIQGVLGIHVDDVLCGGKGKSYESALERLQNRFSFGSWSNAQETTITYCGMEIAQKSDGSLFLCQERFALGIDEIVLTKERKGDTLAEITTEEKRRMRQTLGSLSWRATQSAPWLLAPVSLLQGAVESGRVCDVLAVNKLVRLQRKYFDRGLYFPCLNGDVTVVTFTDASWATRVDGSSQGGQITLLAPKGILNGEKTPFCVLGWSSRRLKRVARSSTSAEAQMCANALDFHEFSKLGWIDLQEPAKVDLRVADEYLRTFESGLIVDARNIYDGLSRVESSGLQMEEKRTAIELLAIKERLHQAAVDLKWVDGEPELADGQTKSGCHEPLFKALYQGWCRITYDSHFLSARKKRAQRYQLCAGEHWLHCLGHWTQQQHTCDRC